MIRPSIILGFLVLLTLSCKPGTSVSESEVSDNNTSQPTADMDKNLLRHVVLIKFKATVSTDDIARVEEAFGALPGKIKEIKDYEWGINNSPEGINQGFTHCFLVTFESEEDRAIYLPHPEHQAFVEILKPHLEDVLVVDYWSR